MNTRTGLRVAASIRYDAATRLATITPTTRRVAYTWYRVEVHSGITDLAGNQVVTASWRFRTGPT